MARTRNSIPTYQRHSSGRARIRTYDANDNRVEIVLPGEYGSEKSQQEYERILSRLRSNGGKLPAERSPKDMTIAELVLKFIAYAKTYYVNPDKEPTSEIAALRAAIRPLVRMYADTPAAEFGPLALQMLRTAMIDGSCLSDEERAKCVRENRPIGLARSTCNKNINRIKLVFKWGASMELIPASVANALATVAGLRRGRSGARETMPVTPISPAVIDDTLPHLPPIVRDMVELLLLSGMRCGELCVMRGCDLDLTGDVWLFRPEKHKGQWRGHQRVVAIGPLAQKIIRKYLTLNTMAYMFTPAAQAEMIQAERRANRRTPLYPSHAKRLAAQKKTSGNRQPGQRFKVGAVNRSIARACKRAGIECWHTHQLRHSASLKFSRELGLEAARAALGHSSVDMSAMYAGHDLQSAQEVARRIG